MYIFLEQFPEQVNFFLMKLLFDKSLSLRELARFYLRKNGVTEIEILKMYKDTIINKTESMHLAIRGLAEIGHQGDFVLIEPYLNDSDLKVKSACIYAIFKLNPHNKQELILAELPSNNRNIMRTMCSGLVKSLEGVDIDAIEKRFCQKGDFYSKKLFIQTRLQVMNDRWDIIEYLLDRFMEKNNDENKKYLKKRIEIWKTALSPNKVFTRPKPESVDQIISKIDELYLNNGKDNFFLALKSRIGSFSTPSFSSISLFLKF